MRIQGFRGNCDFQGKLGICPSLADPYAIGFSKNIVSKKRAAGNEKVFWCSNFTKMLPRCGRAAHVCEANETVQ